MTKKTFASVGLLLLRNSWLRVCHLFSTCDLSGRWLLSDLLLSRLLNSSSVWLLNVNTNRFWQSRGLSYVDFILLTRRLRHNIFRFSDRSRLLLSGCSINLSSLNRSCSYVLFHFLISSSWLSHCLTLNVRLLRLWSLSGGLIIWVCLHFKGVCIIF